VKVVGVYDDAGTFTIKDPPLGPFSISGTGCPTGIDATFTSATYSLSPALFDMG
jgi:hypothetical protein